MIKKRVAACAAVFILMGLSMDVLAFEPYRNYTYGQEGKSEAEPAAYLPSDVLDGADFGIGHFLEPSDVFVAANGEIYIADTGNNRIVVLDAALREARVFDGFENGGKDTFHKPEGVFVTGDKVYVADTENRRIVCLNTDGALQAIYPEPEINLEQEKIKYNPIRISVDRVGRMFVVSRNINNGIVELDKDGKFVSYFGAVKTHATFMDKIWKRIMTQDQIDSGGINIPSEYSSVDVDADGFLYTTVSTSGNGTDSNFIRKLNPAGWDILRRMGFTDPTGDLPVLNDKGEILTSQLVDVCVGKCGMYSVLDQRRGRVFTYDNDGNLLYVFGGLGNSKGTLALPKGLDQMEDGRFLIADSVLNRVVLYTPTAYAESIQQAVQYQSLRNYSLAETEWKNILDTSANFDIAYIGVGKALLRTGSYKEAMEYFQKGGSPKLYSKAKDGYRKEVLNDVFAYVMSGVIAVLILLVVLTVIRRYKKRKRGVL